MLSKLSMQGLIVVSISRSHCQRSVALHAGGRFYIYYCTPTPGPFSSQNHQPQSHIFTRNQPIRFIVTRTCMNMTNLGHTLKLALAYRNVPKFSDRQVWANSADPDQTAPRGAVWSGSTLFAIPSASFGWISLRKCHLVQLLGWIQQNFGCPNI